MESERFFAFVETPGMDDTRVSRESGRGFEFWPAHLASSVGWTALDSHQDLVPTHAADHFGHHVASKREQVADLPPDLDAVPSAPAHLEQHRDLRASLEELSRAKLRLLTRKASFAPS